MSVEAIPQSSFEAGEDLLGERWIIGENAIHTETEKAGHLFGLVDRIDVDAATRLVGACDQ